MAEKSLDQKLSALARDPDSDAFILADAKDADMAHGLSAPGRSPEREAEASAPFRSLDEYRDLIRTNARQGLIDIMLMSASNNEVLTIKERLFDGSPVTPAIRANDTTDIWLASGEAAYAREPSRPFRTATIDHAMCGRVTCTPEQRTRGADLGLYSITLNNNAELDRDTLSAYADFRHEAEAKGFRHFLEVFAPNALQAPIRDIGRFLNDQIARLLAGVTDAERPLFLKIPYHGPAVMEELAAYDRRLVVGILGGSAGTTFDAFHQLLDAKAHGARVALYGRMINHSEHQPLFIQHLRWLADGELNDAAEAVRSYHAALQKAGVAPARSLADDLTATRRASGYSGTAVPVDGGRDATADEAGAESTSPDFTRMSRAEKVRWNLQWWRRVLG